MAISGLALRQSLNHSECAAGVFAVVGRFEVVMVMEGEELAIGREGHRPAEILAEQSGDARIAEDIGILFPINGIA